MEKKQYQTVGRAALIRYLKRKGIRVAGTDLNPFGYTAGSLMVDAFIRIPPAADPGFGRSGGEEGGRRAAGQRL